jgi:hypothetical protein
VKVVYTLTRSIDIVIEIRPVVFDCRYVVRLRRGLDIYIAFWLL